MDKKDNQKNKITVGTVLLYAWMTLGAVYGISVVFTACSQVEYERTHRKCIASHCTSYAEPGGILCTWHKNYDSSKPGYAGLDYYTKRPKAVETTAAATPKKTTSYYGAYKSTRRSSDYYDVNSYSNGDDFADEWADDFDGDSWEDRYDDAYDYWEDHH